MVQHFFTAPAEDGGGACTKVGRYTTLEQAMRVGAERLAGPRRLLDPSGHDRICIRLIPTTRTNRDGTRSRRRFRPRHPIWLYLDATGRVCRWQRHPSEPLQLWGYTSH